jgi:ABC-type cobalt transport system substrate-binding protein
VKSKTILVIAVAIVLLLLLLIAIVVIKNKFGTDDSNEGNITGLSSYTDISYGVESSQI